MKECWRTFNRLSPQEQLYAANELLQSNLEAAINPSAYFQKIVNKTPYSMPREQSGSECLTLTDTKLAEVQTSRPNLTASNTVTCKLRLGL